ncbi:MAG TPA: hypothetical protein VMT22_19920 [Terriglobales bacterium]|jgi:hypothetical protein|nr:hypothetical protein [Terriglobales bacterium]
MHGPILALLTLLFFLRVLGQVLVAFFSVSWLPEMNQWFSGLIPYPALLAIQISMLMVMITISTHIWRGEGLFAERRPASARFLVGFSFLYAGTMALRYVLTMILRPEMRWFGGTIPIFFHFVLAAFILAWGRFHAHRAIFARPGRAC